MPDQPQTAARLSRIRYPSKTTQNGKHFFIVLITRYADRFDDPLHPRRDLDLPGCGDADTLRVDRIRKAADYGGVRLRTSVRGHALARLACSRFGTLLDNGQNIALDVTPQDFVPKLRVLIDVHLGDVMSPQGQQRPALSQGGKRVVAVIDLQELPVSHNMSVGIVLERPFSEGQYRNLARGDVVSAALQGGAFRHRPAPFKNCDER